MLALPEKLAGYLNNGDAVAAVGAAPIQGVHSFVRIRAVPKSGVPREDRRYLNSPYDMWQFWDYLFRRMILRAGWERETGGTTITTSSEMRKKSRLAKRPSRRCSASGFRIWRLCSISERVNVRSEHA